MLGIGVYRAICMQTATMTCWSFKQNAKVRLQSTWCISDEVALPQPVPASIEADLINHLERLSLVEFGNKDGIDRLSKAVQFADTLLSVNVAGIEPMTSVLEDRALYLRADEVTEGNNRETLLRVASKTMEEYYVSPPGNIPLSKMRQYNLVEEMPEKSGLNSS